ncbi:MAG: hypothetical protein N2662_10245 [Bacteroidales bacterium]|nr:hypothetical protein [Bacteroidales bacterium]
MKTFYLLILFLIVSVNIDAQRYTTVKKIPILPESPLHTFVIHFPSEKEAYNELPERSPWYLPVSSGWKYTLTNDLSSISWYATSRFVDSLWYPIATLKSQATGFNEKYVLFRKVVPIPEDWYGLQVFIHADFLASPLTIWVNGIKVGTSNTASWGLEWNLTPYLVFGRLNTILFQCDNPTPETIMLLPSKVWLYAFPNVAIWDFNIRPLKNNKNKTVLEVSALAKSFLAGIDDTYTLEFQLYDRRGQLAFPARRVKIKATQETWVNFQEKLSKYISWEADTPYWYTAIFLLKNKNGETVDAIKYRTGIRTIEYTDSSIILNKNSFAYDSIQNHNLFNIQTTFLANYPYKWIVFDLTPYQAYQNDLLKNIEKQVLTFRNYTPIVAWKISIPLSDQVKESISNTIRKLDSTRPIIWSK